MHSGNIAPQDHLGLQIGDQVQVLANSVKMQIGTVGTIVGFSAGSEHPLVQVSRRGRFLIPARSLVRLGQGISGLTPIG